MGSLKALQDWCRTQCVGYKDVEITNMSSSFRDGLAFCAILHKHRPDLIDFDSLSKENVYENNRLAFEVAETELGIPALLDPEDMVSMKVPDRLSMITYVSQYYNFFTNKSHANPPCLKRPGGSGYGEPTVKKVASPLEEKTTLSESISESQIKHVMSSNCAACGKHVHLVQRFLVDGKLYHRNCFRCKECSSTLLPGSYKLIGDSGSLVCTHHFARTSSFNHNGRPDLNRQAWLSGSISSPEVPSSPGLEIVPEDNTTGKPMTPSANSHTTDYLQSRNKQNETTGVEKKEETKSSSKDKKTEPRPPSPSNPFDESGDEDENRKQEGHPEVANNGVPLCSTKGMARPIPAPRKVSDPSIPARPVPKPRPPRQSQSPAVNGDEGIGNLVIPKPRERSQSPASETPKPKDPPWLALVKQESKKKLAPPPPPPPGIAKPLNNSSSVTQKEEGSRPESLPNPFDDDEDSQQEEVESKERPIPSAVVAVHPWYGISQTADVAGAQTASGKGSPARSESPTSCRSKKRQAPRVPRSSPSALSSSQSSSACPSPALSTESLSSSSSDHGSILRTTPSDPVSQQFSSIDREPLFTKSVSEPSINSPVVSPPSAELQSHPSPMPFIPSTPSYTCSAPSTPLTNRSAGSMRPPPPRPPTTPSPLIGSPSTQPPNTPSKRMNPFNRKASSTVTSPQSRRPKGPRPARPPAPGHGFPLIKRKVQSDQFIPVEDIHVEMGALERQLDDLEQTGVELEQKLRDCSNEEEEERLLVDWFTLIHEKHLLVRREAELVYTVKQQNLEERQADVEYELRCLLNKPEKDWSDDDRDREKQLMAELVTIIEQRNQIINSMDQERQKEEEEDKLVAAMLQKKDFHSESDQKKKPAKFKPIKVLKRLSIKGETTKSPSPRKEKS